MAASVVFSIILVSGLAVFVASQDRTELYSAADAGDYLADEFRAIEAAQGFDLLLNVQNAVGTSVIGCAAALPLVGFAVASPVGAQDAGNLTVQVTAESTQGASSMDNLSALRPFNGSVPGEVDVALHFDGSADQGQAVGFSRRVTHLAHLGARLQREVADCESAVAAIEGGVSGSAVADCTRSDLTPVVQRAARGASSQAAGDGFSFGVTYEVNAGGSCQVAFQVFLDQPGIQGPGGIFSVRLEEEGGATVATTSPAQA